MGKIPLHPGLPCPNRARGGCVFCRPASFTPRSLRSADPLDEQLRRGRQLLLRDRFRLFFGCFQQETPTALATGLLLERCARVLAEPDCVGLILSTRPEAIAADLPPALADLCRETGKDCLVELGVQSIHPRSLRLLNRNHGYGDFIDAVARLHAAGLEVGAHLILGIPGESEADMRASLDAVCALGVQALKLHHLQVIRATPLNSGTTRDGSRCSPWTTTCAFCCASCRTSRQRSPCTGSAPPPIPACWWRRAGGGWPRT